MKTVKEFLNYYIPEMNENQLKAVIPKLEAMLAERAMGELQMLCWADHISDSIKDELWDNYLQDRIAELKTEARVLT